MAAAVQGFLLQRSGFDANLAVQNDGALGMIESMFTILPGICVLIAGLVIALTPLQDKKMNALRLALEKKRAGESYSTEGFGSLVVKENKN